MEELSPFLLDGEDIAMPIRLEHLRQGGRHLNFGAGNGRHQKAPTVTSALAPVITRLTGSVILSFSTQSLALPRARHITRCVYCPTLPIDENPTEVKVFPPSFETCRSTTGIEPCPVARPTPDSISI